MKRVFIIIFLLLCVSPNAHSEDLKATLQDIIFLAQSSFSDATIIAFLETREVNFVLGPKEILELKNAGVSENVIRYLLGRIGAKEPQAYVQADYNAGYSFGASYNACYGSAFYFSIFPFPFFDCNSSCLHSSSKSTNYVQMNGHNYFRHNGHFHQDDLNQFASFSPSTPEKYFHGSWGSGGNRERKWRSNYTNQPRSKDRFTAAPFAQRNSNNFAKSRSYGSFKNGRSKAGNSWGTKRGSTSSRSK